MVITVELKIEEVIFFDIVDSLSSLEKVFENKIRIEADDGGICIATIAKDDNDERGAYFQMNKSQCRILAGILLQVADEHITDG